MGTNNNSGPAVGGELLPCPFCGGEADLYQNDDEKSSTHLQWGVSCAAIACPASNGWTVHARQRDAIEAWNSRQSLTSRQSAGAVDVDAIKRVAYHIDSAVCYIEKAYQSTAYLEADPILQNMRRWAAKLNAALVAALENKDG